MWSHRTCGSCCSYLVLKITSFKIGALLNLTLKELEKVLYYEAYIVTESATDEVEGGLKVGQVITEQQYFELKEQGVEFEAGMGGEVVKDLLKKS